MLRGEGRAGGRRADRRLVVWKVFEPTDMPSTVLWPTRRSRNRRHTYLHHHPPPTQTNRSTIDVRSLDVRLRRAVDGLVPRTPRRPRGTKKTPVRVRGCPVDSQIEGNETPRREDRFFVRTKTVPDGGRGEGGRTVVVVVAAAVVRPAGSVSKRLWLAGPRRFLMDTLTPVVGRLFAPLVVAPVVGGRMQTV